MACDHAWRHQPPVKGGSGIEVVECASCGERRAEGTMGGPLSYLPPELFERARAERPDLIERWVDRPTQDRAERRAAVRRSLEDRGNGRAR